MNAIILAAGKSQSFAPFSYEKPKGLFSVKGETLIRRQIEQLIEAGVKEIYVVVGFMKEKFFFLEQAYPEVRLIVNNNYNTNKGNLYSLYAAREKLGDSYICCSDHYFPHNPFKASETQSFRAVTAKKGKFREFAVDISDAGVITSLDIGGHDRHAMVGHAFFNRKFSQKFRSLLEKEIGDFGVENLFWEEFYDRHRNELTLFARQYDESEIMEFESLDDLRQYDKDFLLNIDSAIVRNICTTLRCSPNDIRQIEIIQKGLTNASFKFVAKGTEYVYRHPGATAGHLIDRESELFAQHTAIVTGIDKSVIRIHPSGWKLSYFVKGAVNADLEDDATLEKAVEYLKKLHSAKYDKRAKKFDTFNEGLKLLKIAVGAKGNLEEEFADIIEKIRNIDREIKNDGLRQEALCHNDVYAPNFLYDKFGTLYLIDWEYAGVNDRANDVACICCRYDFSEGQIERYIRAYLGEEFTEALLDHYLGAVAVCAFYWFCWGLYKGSVNDDDGFFFLPAYRCMMNAIRRSETKGIHAKCVG